MNANTKKARSFLRRPRPSPKKLRAKAAPIERRLPSKGALVGDFRLAASTLMHAIYNVTLFLCPGL